MADSKPSKPSDRRRHPARPLLVVLPLALLVAVWSSACVPKERPSNEKSESAGSREPPSSGSPGALGATTLAAPKKTAAGPERSGVAPTEGTTPRITQTFTADFSKGPLEPIWKPTSPAWAIKEGRLCGENAKNHPVWLTHRLPVNARIEFTAESGDSDGDIKVELWGDGRSHATSTSYTNATSYLAIFGGWQNRYHVLARLDEHGKDRKETALLPNSEDPRTSRVVANQVYRFKIERSDGRTIRWSVDDIEIHTFVDDDPLQGSGHEHLGFNDWTVPVCFDDVVITPLEH